MKTWAWVAILAANVLGGISYLWQKQALAGLPPATVAALRNVIGLACMGLWLLLRGGWTWDYDRRELTRLFLIGNLGFALPMMLGIVGLQWSTAGNGSILILLEPASILLFSWLLLRERVRPLQLLGILLGLAGALVITLEENPIEGLVEGEHLKGNLVLMLHGILWGLYTPLMKPLADGRRSAVALTFAAMALGMVTFVPSALAEMDAWHGGPELAGAMLRVLWLGVGVSFASTVLWTLSLRWLRAAEVAPFVFLQPITGVVAGWVVLDEPVTREALLGGALIAIGVLAVVWRRRRPG